MKTQLILLAMGLILPGCSHLYSHQVSVEIGTNGVPRTVTTDLRTTTFFDSKSELAKYSARQSEKSQSLGIGSLQQEASGTNVVEFAERIVKAAIQAAKTP